MRAQVENSPLIDAAGRRRSPATLPEFRRGQRPANYGKKLPGEIFEPSQVLRILGAPSPTAPSGVRDRALIVVLWRSGMRISEALSLRPIDLHESTGYIRIRKGRNRKSRDVVLFGSAESSTWAWDELRRWLVRRERMGFPPDGPLFCIVEGQTKGALMQPSTVRAALKKYATKAGVTDRVHPHGFRHTLAAELARAGVPLIAVRDQLGHSSLGVTHEYLLSIGVSETMDTRLTYQPNWSAEAT